MLPPFPVYRDLFFFPYGKMLEVKEKPLAAQYGPCFYALLDLDDIIFKLLRNVFLEDH